MRVDTDGRHRARVKSFRENSQTHAEYGAEHHCRARSARGDGKWNECSPLVTSKVAKSMKVQNLCMLVHFSWDIKSVITHWISTEF